MSDERVLDGAIVGGGPAGLSAALMLGRARKNVAVLDAGSPRHAVSDGVHNFLTREGMPPAELRRVAWAQMATYPTVRHLPEAVVALERDEARGLWHLATASATLRARAVLLAVGVVDEHPQIPGYAERWGKSIHHCPYCHGWELRERPLAVLADGEAAAHLPLLLRGWSDDVVLLTNARPLPDEVREALAARAIPIDARPIAALEGAGHELEAIVFEDGERLARRGLFVAARQHQVPLVQALGVELDEDGFVRVDMMQRTSRPGLWAAGDCTLRYRQQVLEAAASGARAGAAINAELTVGGLP